MIRKLSRWVAVPLILSFCISAFAAVDNKKIDQFINQFIDYMVKEHQFNKAQLEKWFNQIEIDEIVTKKMDTPYEAKPWYLYRKHFLTDKRINLGVKYWQEHQKTLQLAEEEFGVPASVIIAILGVETEYGNMQGNFVVMQSLATLAFNYPSRARYFKKELEAFLLMTREQEMDPLSIKGSYAGAIGMPQFMPSSYRAYALKFTGNKHLDLTKHHHDAIGSVANYLSKHGWKSKQPIALPVKLENDKAKQLVQKHIKSQYNLNQLKRAGVKVEGEVPSSKRYMLFAYDQPKEVDYWLGLDNFYVIARYNNSSAYVLAVKELSQAIEKAHQAATSKTNA